ncbi:MAG: hypothetical protein M3198_08930 [Actinomycetota bacterium]|nr:hypothetical protein [Actinomycetota bacterium]
MTDSKTDKAPVPGVPKDSADDNKQPKDPQPEENSETAPSDDAAASGPGFDQAFRGGS